MRIVRPKTAKLTKISDIPFTVPFTLKGGGSAVYIRTKHVTSGVTEIVDLETGDRYTDSGEAEVIFDNSELHLG